MQRSYTYVGYIDSSYSIQATRFHTVCKSIVCQNESQIHAQTSVKYGDNNINQSLDFI